jgi:hypothetical protein
MRYIRGFIFGLAVLLLAACKPSSPICPPEPVRSGGSSEGLQASPLQTPLPPLPANIEIGGKSILVDQIVSGTLCDGSWEGVVYVPCGIMVAAWEEDPLFLKACELEIAPGTVVYVGAHNDAPYYKGCSCHTGELP